MSETESGAEGAAELGGGEVGEVAAEQGGADGGAADDQRWLAMAVELATQNVRDGGGPFGAVIVRDGMLLATGQNRVTRDFDPTAHAEVMAIRAAGAALGDFSLAGATLYTSCEPCPMCATASLWARLDRVVFAADRHDAARGGFDDLEFYELLTRDRATWPTVVQPVDLGNRTEPFDTWLETTTRTEY
ncbi:nucleoside deaminase [Marisediminicola senii]|uniref:nucleoside deaminase n=1 Tax=Marisediminicola senii TaxID=2711233 RepID=UPI0022A6FACD|nr:nucleoside deaminase [Marisediminicola senii]